MVAVDFSPWRNGRSKNSRRMATLENGYAAWNSPDNPDHCSRRGHEALFRGNFTHGCADVFKISVSSVSLWFTGKRSGSPDRQG